MRLYKGLDKDYCDWHTGKNKHVQGAEFSIAKDLRSTELCSSGMFHASRELFHTSKYGYCATAAEIQTDCIVDEHTDDKCGLHEYKVVRLLDNEQARAQIETELKEELGHEIDLRPITYFFRRKRSPTKDDVALLRKWSSVLASVRSSVWASVRSSVWASVLDSVWASVLDSVLDSVWDSVWASVIDPVWESVKYSVRESVCDSVKYSVRESVMAYIGSLFQEVTAWKYVTHDDGVYPFQAAADLVKRGLMPCMDDKKIFLLSGKKFQVMHEERSEI